METRNPADQLARDNFFPLRIVGRNSEFSRPLKKGSTTVGLYRSASEKTLENTAGQASSGTHNL